MNGRAASRDCLVVFGIGLVVRLIFLFVFPVPYGNDCIGRIYFKDFFFLAHWLPVTQVLVYLPARLSDNILFIRVTFALLGSLAACGFYFFLSDMVSRRVAVFGGLLFSLNSLYVVLSLMPYQDVIFLGLFYAALAVLFGTAPLLKSPTGSILFGLACLTRYESWFILPVLVWWRMKVDRNASRRVAGWVSFFRSAIFFGWGPMIWLALSWSQLEEWNRVFLQTADQSFYAWSPHIDLEWAAEYSQKMGYWLLRFGSPVAVFSVLGLTSVVRHWGVVWSKLKLLLGFGGVVLIFFFFIIGQEFEDVNRFVMIPLSIVLVLTTLGVDSLSAWLAKRTEAWTAKPTYWTAFGLFIGFMLVYSAVTMKRLNARPEFRTPFEVANYLDSALGEKDKAIIVAQRSRDLTDAAPMAYQRLIAQSKIGRDRILCAGLLGMNARSELWKFTEQNQIRYLAVFEDFEPWLAADRFFTELTQSPTGAVKVFKAGQASVYEIVSYIR